MKEKKTTLRSGQEVWTSGLVKKSALPGKKTISVGRRKKYKKKASFDFLIKIMFCLILITFLGVLGAWYITKPQAAKPKIEKGGLYVTLKGSELIVTWPNITGADVIRLYRARTGQEDILCGEYTGSSAILSGIASGELVYLRVEAVKFSSNILGEAGESIAKTKTIRIIPVELEQPLVKKKVDMDARTISLNWDAGIGNIYEICQYDGDGSDEVLSLQEDRTGNILISTENFDSDEQRKVVDIAVRAIRKGDGYVCAGDWSQRILIKPEDLMGLNPSLTYARVGERIYSLQWQETRGDCCELQQWSEAQQEWISVKFFPDWSEELMYTTNRLPSCREVRFRVLVYEGERSSGRLAVDPSEISFWTDVSPLYCTIWPIKELKLFSDAYGAETVGNVPAGKALSVIGEDNGRFHVSCNKTYGYIDSDYCLINLPEYLGDLCIYNIANSYESIFTVNRNAIPEITGTVILGYENVCLKNDEMLVPFLYPCAKRLEPAARAMREDGYVACIYDAFRPHKATQYLYSTAEKFMGNIVVGRNWTTLLGQGDIQSKYDRAVRAKQLREDHLLKWTESEDAGIYGNTYLKEMTNGNYSLSAFLAKTISAHNRGIALDLTLTDIKTGGELFMQSDMHDLSWHSVLIRNNTNARLLARYMLDAGFNELSSEWWHFQDDTTRQRIRLETYLEDGLSIEGWKRDDTGWRYRLGDGSYYSSITISIDGVDRIFDAEGYLQ